MEKLPALPDLNNVSEIDIIYKRKTHCKMSQRPLIASSLSAYEILCHYWNMDKIDLLEEFKVLFLNRANRVLQIITISQGGITGTVADTRLILATALKLASCSIILSHNHPSGNLKPSVADNELTTKVKEAARLLDIKVLDHLIVTSEGYFSYADEGLL